MRVCRAGIRLPFPEAHRTWSNHGPRCFSAASRSCVRSWLAVARSASAFLSCIRNTRLSAVSLATTCGGAR